MEWAVVQSQMRTAVPDYISDQYLRNNCTDSPLPSVSQSSFAQAAIADVSVCVCAHCYFVLHVLLQRICHNIGQGSLCSEQ